jgi:hypothetical protein
MWLTKSETQQARPWVEVVRPRPGQTVRVMIVGEPLRLFIHFHRRRTWPCTLVHCPLCKQHVSRRIYSYYPAVKPCGTRVLLELTALGEESLLKEMEEVTTEPSGIASVSRPGGRRNQPVKVEWVPGDPEKAKKHGRLGTSWTQSALFRLWDLPEPSDDLCNGEHAEHLAKVIASRVGTKSDDS